MAVLEAQNDVLVNAGIELREIEKHEFGD